MPDRAGLPNGSDEDLDLWITEKQDGYLRFPFSDSVYLARGTLYIRHCHYLIFIMGLLIHSRDLRHSTNRHTEPDCRGMKTGIYLVYACCKVRNKAKSSLPLPPRTFPMHGVKEHRTRTSYLRLGKIGVFTEHWCTIRP